MPPVDWGAHLIGYLFECGPVNAGGMGPVPLTDRDVLAWRENQGVDLTAWEAGLLIRLSRAYCNGLSEYATATAPPPWTPPIDEVKAKQATNAFADWAKRMAASR